MHRISDLRPRFNDLRDLSSLLEMNGSEYVILLFNESSCYILSSI